MITKALKFLDAIAFIVDKVIVPDDEWDQQDWFDEEGEIETRAFFSSRVENARFLERGKGFIEDRLKETVEDTPGGPALKAGGRADFVRSMREFMVKEGMADERDFEEINNKDVTELGSISRLSLIYKTNMDSAHGYGRWKQGNKPNIIKLWPAQRFVRDFNVQEPRPRHEESIGDVRLKSDTAYWADYQNDPEIGGFNVPWPPFGFNSAMGVEDVSRADAISLGLNVDDAEPPEEVGFNDNLQVTTKTMSPEIEDKLVDVIKDAERVSEVADQAKHGQHRAEISGTKPRDCPSGICWRIIHAMIVSALDSTIIDEGNNIASIVYVPEGIHTITPLVDGVAKEVTVNMTAEQGEAIAAGMQASLDERLANNVRPFFDFDHNDTGPAAALPKRFYYEEGKGLIAEIEWTGSGKKAIDAKDYSYFSPTFLLGDNGLPAGLPQSGPIGALVNEPAFRNIPRIAAAYAENQTNKQPMSELITCGLLTEAEGASVELATKRVAAMKAEAQKVEAMQNDLEETTKKLETAEAKLQEVKEAGAASLVEAAVAEGRIAAKDEVTQDFWKSQIVSNGESAISALNAVQPIGGDITKAKVSASVEPKEKVELHGVSLIAAALADEQESN